MTEWIENTYQGNDLKYLPDNLEPMDIVMCNLRNGNMFYSRGYYFDWKKYGKGSDIMEYRILTEEEFKEQNKKYERVLKSIIN
jgi:hypothetical protein